MILEKIKEFLKHEPTAEQHQAIVTFSQFLTDRDPQAAMLLCGAAGTGKTTLAAAIVRALLSLRQKIVLLAPTGRAAKVLSLYAGYPAYTIHRRIYRQRTAGDLSAFSLNANLQGDVLFLVDEASMISASHNSDTFGSGCLLDDLVSFVYQGNNCRLMLIGDRAQLPPVGEEQSPALLPEMLEGYGLKVHRADMSEVLRQSQQSGILWNATLVRQMLCSDSPVGLPILRLHGFAEITAVPGDELIESLASSYSRVGIDETIVVTRSNKRANIYNQGIRNTVLDREEELCRGDQLMIVKNNYSLTPAPSRLSPNPSLVGRGVVTPTSEKADVQGNCPPPYKGGVGGESFYLANGDRCVVQRVRRQHELYGFRFAEVTIQLPDYDDLELACTTLLDTLTTEAPALTREQQELLYNNVMEDYADVPLKADRLKQLRQDVHYNALQVKYGYAVTCHKAQGGQWAHVYIDQGYMTDDMLTSDYLHWLYTALTRATEHVFLVNWPKAQIEK